MDNNVMFLDDRNPAFNYLEENYFIDVSMLSKIADAIYQFAYSKALKISKPKHIEINNDLVHFFYDLFLVLEYKLLINCFIDKHDLSDKISAALDGMHIKYFGQYSFNIIDSIIALEATREKCLYKSFMHILGKSNYLNIICNLLQVVIKDSRATVHDYYLIQLIDHIEEASNVLNKDILNIINLYNNT